MKTTAQIATLAAVLFFAPIASAQTTITPEECAATFSARLAAARAEIESFTRSRHDPQSSFAQRVVPENVACEADDTAHRISLVLPPLAPNMDRDANLRLATAMLQILCYGVASERCDGARAALRASRARARP